MKLLLGALSLLLTQAPATPALQQIRVAVQGKVIQLESMDPIPDARVTFALLAATDGLDALKNMLQAMGAPPGVLEEMIEETQEKSPDEIQRMIDQMRGQAMPAEVLNYLAQLKTAKTERPGFPVHVLSDASGQFTIANVPPGDYTVTVTRDGFLGVDPKDPYSPKQFSSMPVHVVAQQFAPSLTVSMVRPAQITGRIRDASGQVLPNIEVQASTVVYQNGRRILQGVVTKSTDDRGEYRLFGLPAGQDYIITAAPKAQRPVPGSSATLPIQTFYPGTAEFALATPVTVRSGEELKGIDLTLRTAPALKITGRIVVSSALPVYSTTQFVVSVADSGSNE